MAARGATHVAAHVTAHGTAHVAAHGTAHGTAHGKRKRPDAPVPHPSAACLAPPRRPLPPHQLVLAPMVGASELAFRLLARRHGAQLCYTPMMHADKFARDPAYRAAELQTTAEDAPLVAHFCGNDASTLVAAARLAEAQACAIDLNLGCPQRSAHSGRYGAFLCTTPTDRERVVQMVSALAHAVRIPAFCKIRLLDDEAETLAFCQQLQAAGCALLAVHARRRGDPMHRRSGPADLAQVARIKEALDIPVRPSPRT
jgi:tRNA-dihydrouridine synthase 1